MIEPLSRCQNHAAYMCHIRNRQMDASYRICPGHLHAVISVMPPGGDVVITVVRLENSRYLCDNSAREPTLELRRENPGKPAADPWQTPAQAMENRPAPTAVPETPPPGDDGMCDRCHTATAAYTVLLGDSTVLLLCGHHTTQHRAALEAKGALITERNSHA